MGLAQKGLDGERRRMDAQQTAWSLAQGAIRGTYVVLPLLEDEAQKRLHVVLPKGALQVLGARQHALGVFVVVVVGMSEMMERGRWLGRQARARGGAVGYISTDLGDVEEDGVRLQHLVDVRLGLVIDNQ